MNYNKVIISGRICVDPQSRVTNSGLTVLRLPVAVNAFKKKADGEKTEEAHFFNVVFFGKLAELVEKYMVKGQVILVDGRLSTSEYVDKQEIKRYSTEILADTMQMGSKPRGYQDNRDIPNPAQASQPAQSVPTKKVTVDDNDDIKIEDIPF